MNRRTLLRLAALTGFVATPQLRSFALAQSKLVLKASDVHPLGYPTVEAVIALGKKVEEQAAGASVFRCIRPCNSAARRR